jgi:probable HAF family extracellular repeat protein
MHGFLESGGTYTTLDDPSATQGTVARGINDAGQIVGFYTNATGQHGFLLSGGTYTTLDDPLATLGTVATGINASGQIVGWYSNASGTHGFLYFDGLYAPIDDPLAAHVATAGTFASGINASGQIVGSYVDATGGNHGFLYNPNGGTYTTLDDPLGTNTQAFDINDAGEIVGQYSFSQSFLYSGGVFTTVDDPVVNGHTHVNGINNNGQIVGILNDGTGDHGFLETTVPNTPPPGGTTADMILRGANTSPAVAGQYEIYDIGSNSILAGYSLGTVGTDWQFAGLGRFFGNDTTDMLLRSASTGGFEVYDISNNNITNAAF